MTLTWAGAPDLPQLPFGRLFRRLDRPVPEGAGIVTAYTDGQVTLRSNRAKERYHEAADLSSFQGVAVGDFVVHGLDILRGSVGISDSAGAMSPVVSVCEPTGPVDPRFVSHVIRTQAAAGFTKAMARGIREGGADFRRWGTLAELPIPVPSLDYQRRVCDYLDCEMARIDTLIEEQQRLVGMLRERRRLVITNAISPKPRLGSCADKLGRTARIGNGSTPRRENREYWDSGTVPWLNSSVVNQARVGSAVEFVTASALAECHLPIVPPGSVLVGLTGQGKTRGMATILDIESTVNQHLAYVTPDRTRWWPEYLLWLLTAAYDDLRRISEENGSTKGGLTCEALKQLRVTVPPIDEQRRIAFHLDQQTAKTDTLIAETERFIDLARERRSALVTAAVTGQIDVRKAA